MTGVAIPYLCRMIFHEVIGQENVKHRLADLFNRNRLGHALLFLGREGSGALPLALAFAQYIVCERSSGRTAKATGPSLFADPSPTPKDEVSQAADACGTCASCIKAAQLIHPDIHFSYPVIARKSGEKPISTDFIQEWREFITAQPYGNVFDWLQHIGAENKQGNITAAECNDIIRKISLKSYEGAYKILILWMPEYLEKEGNKLLKIIEEPPGDSLFILVAENESLILPTLLSRCQLIKIPALDHDAIRESLSKKEGLPAGQADQVAAVAEGNYREALQLLHQSDEDWQTLLRDWLNTILKTGPAAQVKWVDEAAKLGREKQKQFLRYFNHLLEQAVRIRAIGEAGADKIHIPANELDFAERLNKIADISQQQALIEELDKASYYIERNANAKMLFMALTIKCYHIFANKSVILMDDE